MIEGFPKPMGTCSSCKYFSKKVYGPRQIEAGKCFIDFKKGKNHKIHWVGSLHSCDKWKLFIPNHALETQ